jgi:predicted membrane channel-forming protein YqfA (hemolysin III family)
VGFFFTRAYREVMAGRDWDAPLRDLQRDVFDASRNRLMITAIVTVMALVLIAATNSVAMVIIGVGLVAVAIRVQWSWRQRIRTEPVVLRLAFGLLVLFTGGIVLSCLAAGANWIVSR